MGFGSKGNQVGRKRKGKTTQNGAPLVHETATVRLVVVVIEKEKYSLATSYS
jgi:hypothetical protein